MNDSDFMARGYWRQGQISTAIIESTYTPTAQLSALIDTAWTTACARPGVHLFDGPLCRFEQLIADPDHFHLVVSRCSYKQFLGTNGCHAQWAARHGWASLANAVGTSAALVSGDGWLVFGRRSTAVALYPGWAHPFGGILEPGETLDLLAEMQRELHEEIGLSADEVSELACIGLVRDPHLLQPELIYVARTPLPLAELERRLDAGEHTDCWSVRASVVAITAALHGEQLTPVTRLVLQRYCEMV